MENNEALSLNRPEFHSTNPPGHSWRDKKTALSRPLPTGLLVSVGAAADGGGGGAESAFMVNPKPKRERVVYGQPNGPNPLNHRDHFGGSALW